MQLEESAICHFCHSPFSYIRKRRYKKFCSKDCCSKSTRQTVKNLNNTKNTQVSIHLDIATDEISNKKSLLRDQKNQITDQFKILKETISILQRENKCLKSDRDILKEATILFARDAAG